MRRKTADKVKTSPEKASRRTSRRGRKSPEKDETAENERNEEGDEEQPAAVVAGQLSTTKSDDSESDHEEEETNRRSRRRSTRAKVSEEKTVTRVRRSSRRKSLSVEPSDKEESEREENGDHDQKETTVMETIEEEKIEEAPEAAMVETESETVEEKPVEEVSLHESHEDDNSAEPVGNNDNGPDNEDINEENNVENKAENNTSARDDEEESNDVDEEPSKELTPQEVQVDVHDQSRESGEVDSESVQEDESLPPTFEPEKPTEEASPEKEASEDVSPAETVEKPTELPKPPRKSRFRSRSKSPKPVEVIETNETEQEEANDKSNDDLEAGEIRDDPVVRTSPEKKPVEPVRRTLQKKRRWISSKTDTKSSVITISTDSLKNIISEPVKPVPLSEAKLESSPEPEEIVDSTEERSAANLERRRSKDVISKSSEKENFDNGSALAEEYKPKPADKLNPGTVRKISIVSDDGNNPVVRPPSPAKHHSSNILYISNLVRPFTVMQLKGLLARTGKIVENGFWIDKIKSKCYVKYETEDEAVETRHALHGVRWPTSNPKCLNVDFGSEAGMEKAIISTLDDAGTTRITIENTKDAREFGWSRDLKSEEETHVNRPVREWDLGKKDAFEHDRDRPDRERERGDRERDREREREKERERDRGGRRRSAERDYGRDRDRERRRNSTSLSPARKFKKKENEQPIRLLDDLFRKTKTTPCIYWLPLTAEQIAAKEEHRRKEQADNQRRQEELRKQDEERRKEREARREREQRRDQGRPRSNSRDRRPRRSRSRDDGRRRHR
ncbi:apoptotic chromatin condensation inducer in the nucleus [Uranotaenia lowii]|uniref:apoptotic chromatin condensation inducer in the nucleus n=1 Tax=Uranotaenia lowii TaxID=190385 RepID=UPI0024793EC1|nr:apoptotic chromatin condensation inducer in the nucleus [Uranotaenia lowii]